MAFVKSYLMIMDIKQRKSSPVPVFKQGETAQLLFKIYDDGQLYDLNGYTRSELSFTLPDNSKLVGNATLNSDNLIEYNFVGVEMSQVGDVKVIASIYSGATVVSTQPFTIHIYDNMKSGDLSYIGILQDLIAEVQVLKDEVTTTLNEANQLKNDMDTFFVNAEAEEDIRIANEITRISSENIRISNENTRKSNEVSRVSQEIIRQNNESTRETNELARQTVFTTIQDSVGGLSYKNAYDISVQYYKNNIVTFNGSSYIALQDNINQYPPIPPIETNTYWKLIARKGDDGNGTVTIIKDTFIATENQTLFTLSGTYDQFQNRIKVYVNGVVQFSPINFTETSSNSITLTEGIPNGTEVIVEYFTQSIPLASDIQTTVDNHTTILNEHLPKKASTTELGHVKIDGTSITINSDGVISSSGENSTALTNHINDYMPHNSELNRYATQIDGNGIYTVIEYKRTNNTLYMKSIASNPNIEGKYQTFTWQFYETDGTTLALTKTWTIVWDTNGIAISMEVN